VRPDVDDRSSLMPFFNDLYTLGNAIDTFAPGHYARVYDSLDQRTRQSGAFKVMRAEHRADDGNPRWEAMAFVNEADLLARMADSPQVIRLLDCGYLSAADDSVTSGQIESFGLNVETFRQNIYQYAGHRWRPYLTLEVLPRGENLLYLMKPNSAGTRWRLPTEEGIALAYQFANVLQQAHRQQIVYLDHKLEHVYWNGSNLRIIDWNSSKLIEKGNPTLSSQIANDIHNLCVGILYSIFTGLSPHKGSLMAQPASQAELETRYKEIDQLDFGVEPTLSAALQGLLQQGAQRQIASADQFIAGLDKAAEAFGWHALEKRRREAREQVKAGLAKLRQGQDSIREARDMLREAAIIEDIGGDLDAELRRLLGKINEMLNCRVIP
jgi:serine/threonine protein kinase